MELFVLLLSASGIFGSCWIWTQRQRTLRHRRAHLAELGVAHVVRHAIADVSLSAVCPRNDDARIIPSAARQYLTEMSAETSCRPIICVLWESDFFWYHRSRVETTTGEDRVAFTLCRQGRKWWIHRGVSAWTLPKYSVTVPAPKQTRSSNYTVAMQPAPESKRSWRHSLGKLSHWKYMRVIQSFHEFVVAACSCGPQSTWARMTNFWSNTREKAIWRHSISNGRKLSLRSIVGVGTGWPSPEVGRLLAGLPPIHGKTPEFSDITGSKFLSRSHLASQNREPRRWFGRIPF